MIRPEEADAPEPESPLPESPEPEGKGALEAEESAEPEGSPEPEPEESITVVVARGASVVATVALLFRPWTCTVADKNATAKRYVCAMALPEQRCGDTAESP